MPQISPLYWPVIFIILVYFLTVTNTNLSKLNLSSTIPSSQSITNNNNELNW